MRGMSVPRLHGRGDGNRAIKTSGRCCPVGDRGAVNAAEGHYAKRFAGYRREDLGAYRFYLFRPSRLKLFDEHDFGAGMFVTARLTSDRRLAWERTELYRPTA